MFIVEVIPLTNLPQSIPQLLSYFFNSCLSKGSLVEILIGKRRVKAVVVSSVPIEQEKHILKKSQFQLKKLSKAISYEPKVSDIQFKIAIWLSKNYYAPLGLSLKTVLSSKNKLGNIHSNKSTAKPLILISSAKKTIKIISQYIKEVEGQVLILVPDKTICSHLAVELKPKFDPTKLVLGTRKTLFSQFNLSGQKNLKLIIVEDPMNEIYKSEMTPKYNTPDLAEEIARLHGADIIFISPVAGVKNHYKIKNNDYELRNKNNGSQPEIKVVNIINDIRTDNPDILSKELKENIAKTINGGKRVLVFSPRKGFASLLVCQNCSSAIKCPNCSVPLKIHRSINLSLKCHRCTYVQQFPKFCPNCNSYKLKIAGPAGTQKIYDRIKSFLVQNEIKAPVFILDSDITKNETEEEEIIEEVQKLKPSILIATQMIFSYRYSLNFSVIGVINTDSLITVPNYNAEERLLYQLKKLIDFEPDKLIIQTYNPDSETLKSLASNDYEQFYDNELKIRKLLNYPPFSKLIKLTCKDKNQKKAFIAARTLVEKLRMAVVQLGVSDKITVSDSTPGFTEKEKGLYNYHIILKSAADETPREILKFVPAGWSIDVDPRTIL